MESIKDLPHTVTEQMPIVSPDRPGRPSALTELTAYRRFIEYGGRYGTHWKNVVSLLNIKAPILMVVVTKDARNNVTEAVYNMIEQFKEFVAINGGHFGLLYYPNSNC